jgi:hypothetical protein
VISVANRFRHSGVEWGDLVAGGIEGLKKVNQAIHIGCCLPSGYYVFLKGHQLASAWVLLQSIDKYDPDSGCKFCTYSYWWIFQGIHRQLNSELIDPYSISLKNAGVCRAIKDYAWTALFWL